MRFDTAQAVESLVWQMRLSEFPRAANRALINSLANGAPPYTDQEAAQNRITTNVNYLELANITHSARRQFSNAFLNVDPPFSVAIDYGPTWRKREYSDKVTKKISRILKKSLKWFEMRRSVFASTVLHGIAPSNWANPYSWCPDFLGVEDVLVPADTTLTLTNLPMFAIYRQYTAMQLWNMTHRGKVDPAWNMKMVDTAIKWVDEKARTLSGSSWPSYWSPEKMEERIKSDGALYASDAVPTIDAYDLYYWSEEGKKCGWRRRMVFDAWGSNAGPLGGAGGEMTIPDKSLYGTRGEFLYNSGERVYARELSQIMHWQFADGSSVAPFKYHSVRSLGFLLYAVCHLQNRLRCKFNDATFEAMLQYFRVANPQDMERLTQVNLIDKGVIPEGLEFVGRDQRWQTPFGEIQQAMTLNRQTMADNSVSFTQDWDFGREDRAKETATRTRAKNTASAALVGAMLSQGYKYEEFRYNEMGRRFCIPNSKDPEVRKFRACMLEDGVPEEALNPERWDITATKIIGSGDKELQIAIAEALMRVRGFIDPAGQKKIDRLYISSYTEDYELTNDLVPEVRAVSRGQELASLACGTLMAGMQVVIQEGIDHAGYVEAMLANMGTKVQQIEQNGGMATQEEILGLANMAQHIEQHIQMIAQNPAEKARVKQYGDDLKQLMNLVKAYAQRLAEQQQAMQQQQGNGADPEAQAKIQAQLMATEAKNKMTAESHAQRTTQRQLQFEQQMKQDAERHALELQKQRVELEHSLAATELETASSIRQNVVATAAKAAEKPSEPKE